MSHRYRVLQGDRPRGLHVHPQDCCRPGLDGRLDLPGGRRPGLRVSQLSHLHQYGAGSAKGVVIGVALATLHDDPVGHAAAVGKALHPVDVQAGQTGRGGKLQAGGGPTGDVSRLGAGHLRQVAPRPVLQFLDGYAPAGGFPHGLHGFRGHGRPPQASQRPGGIDHPADAQTSVDVFQGD